MATRLVGRLGWGMTRDTEGHRDYNIKWLVATDSAQDGPDRVVLTPGLPLPGSKWVFGSGAIDVFARCRWDADVSEHDAIEGQPGYWWQVGQKFSTRPEKKNNNNPNSQGKGDPLDIKDKISGGSIIYQEEATRDKDEQPIYNSAKELMKGPQVEFDKSRANITIDQKRLSLEWPLCQGMLNTLNDRPLWGFPVRSIKLGKFDWDVLYYQDSSQYYSRKFEFEIRTRIDTSAVGNPVIGDWDRTVVDEGTKCIRGDWGRNPLFAGTYRKWVIKAGMNKNNPRDFQKFIDFDGNYAHVILNGNGAPFDDTVDPKPGSIFIQKYTESNFLLLGIPTGV